MKKLERCKIGENPGILTGCDFAVALALELKALLVEGGLASVELGVEEVDLALAHILLVGLALVLLFGDLTLHVFKLALALLNGRIELHGLLRRVLQVLLEVGHLAGQLSLRGTILSILLLYLGKVLELDRFTLEYTSLHVLDEFLLLLTEELILQLHSVDLFPHGNIFCLTNCWVQSILHLFFELDLTLP